MDLNTSLSSLATYPEKVDFLRGRIDHMETSLSASPESSRKPTIAKIQVLYKSLCEVHLENSKIEAALIQSSKALNFGSNEDLYAINFLCLHSLNLKERARNAIYRCNELYPHNPMFKSYLAEYKSVTLLSTKVASEAQARPPSMPVLDEEKMKMMGNMDDSQINSMVQMMKGMNNKSQFESMTGRTLSDQEYQSMMGMMNPETIKMAMNMMKSNPDILKNLPTNPQVPFNMPQPYFAPPQNPQNTPLMPELPPRPATRHPVDPMSNPQSIFNNLPQGMMGEGCPNILDNRAMIRSVLEMFRSNPKSMLSSIGQMTNNSQVNALSNISETKLKVLANIVYYLVSIGLEAAYYFKRFKIQIIVFVIAFLLYKLM